MGPVLIVTGLVEEEQNEIVALAERLGATVNLSFSKDDPFDFCVAKTVNSPKYLLARARGVPAATPAWLRDSVALGAFIELDGPDVPSGYKPPPFAGLSVCVTGHSQDERADIERRVVAGGGAYASDLVKGVCTHLIAADTTSAKYAHASRWDGVCIVNKDWVEACIAERSRVDETKFPVARDSSEGTRPRDAGGAARISKDAKDEDFSPEDDSSERAGRLVPWGSKGCFLLSTRVCLFGFEKDSDEHIRALRVVRHAGAGTVSNPAKATHVVVRDDPPDGSLRGLREFRDRVVHFSWLEACEAELGVAEEEPHLVAPSLFVAVAARERGAPRDEKAETSSRRVAPEEKARPRGLREAARGRADRAPEREPRRRGGDPSAPNPLTRAALAKEAEAEATRAAAPADQNRPPDAGNSPFPATGTELPATAFAVPETANGADRHGIAGVCVLAEGGDEGGGQSAAAAVFRGVRVALSPLLSREEEDAARDFISAGSGIAVACVDPQGFAPATAKYVVCPAAPTAEERRALLAAPAAERAKQVTCHWLETCVQQERVVELTEPAGKGRGARPTSNPAYRPLPCDAPLPSMQSLRISTSTYDERIKASVHMLCHLLGARYTDRLGRNKNTHLVAPAAEGAKYTAAVSWGIHVVTVEWLHACVAAGERVDEAGFAPPPPEPDDETEAPGGSGSAGAREDADADNARPCSAPETRDGAANEDSQRPRGSQRQRSAAHQVGNATARASLSAVLQVSQPAAVAVADVPAPPPAATTPAPMRAPARRPASSARAKSARPKTPKTPKTHVAAPDAAPETQRGTRRAGGRGGATPSPRVGARSPPAAAAARAPPDGSQFAANMIDDVAAGMLGAVSAGDPGSLALDDVGDGFRVPDAVFGKHALASPSKTGSQLSRGDDADGTSSGKKRRRDAHSQGDLETQHMVGLVGYADDDQKKPVRRGGPRGGEKPSEKRQNAGLVTSLLEGGGAGGGARGAGLRVEDWE